MHLVKRVINIHTLPASVAEPLLDRTGLRLHCRAAIGQDWIDSEAPTDISSACWTACVCLCSGVRPASGSRQTNNGVTAASLTKPRRQVPTANRIMDGGPSDGGLCVKADTRVGRSRGERSRRIILCSPGCTSNQHFLLLIFQNIQREIFREQTAGQPLMFVVVFSSSEDESFAPLLGLTHQVCYVSLPIN